MDEKIDAEIIKHCAIALDLDEWNVEDFLNRSVKSAELKVSLKIDEEKIEEVKETLLNKLENEEIEKVVKLTAELVVEARRSNKIEEMEDE